MDTVRDFAVAVHNGAVLLSTSARHSLLRGLVDHSVADRAILDSLLQGVLRQCASPVYAIRAAERGNVELFEALLDTLSVRGMPASKRGVARRLLDNRASVFAGVDQATASRIVNVCAEHVRFDEGLHRDLLTAQGCPTPISPGKVLRKRRTLPSFGSKKRVVAAWGAGCVGPANCA